MRNNLTKIYEKEALEKSQLISYNFKAAALKKERILEEANISKNKSVLEIGCGEGQLINHINSDDKLGVDISPTRIKQATENARKLGTNTKFLVGDAQNLLLNKKFDIIICSEIIEHLPKPEKLIEEIRKVMKEDSKLILTTPNILSLRRIMAKVITGRTGDKTHLHTFSHKQLEKMLRKKGFNNIKRIPLTFEYIFYNRIPLGKFFDKLDFGLRKKFAEKFPELSDLIFLVVKYNEEKKKKIVILTSTGIGDIITLAPVVKKLKEIYPKSEIIVQTKKNNIKNLKIFCIDRIEKLNLKEKADILIGFGYYSRISGRLRTLLYHLIRFFSKAGKKIFYRDLDVTEFRNKNMTQIKLDILKKLNLKINKEDYKLFLPFSFEKVRRIKRKNPLVIFHVGAKKNYFTRFWPRDRWIKIINYLKNDYKADICFIGGKDDIKKTKDIINRLNFSVLNLVEKLSINETASVINNSDLLISTNSGPMWIAAALHKPQIALCGPSKFSWEPYNNKATVIRKIINRKYCNPPCDAKFCKYKDNLCMKKIKTEQVIKAIDKIMKNKK